MWVQPSIMMFVTGRGMGALRRPACAVQFILAVGKRAEQAILEVRVIGMHGQRTHKHVLASLIEP